MANFHKDKCQGEKRISSQYAEAKVLKVELEVDQNYWQRKLFFVTMTVNCISKRVCGAK